MKPAFSIPNNHVADVIVIGGGLHGCSTALHLAKRGVSVIVLEKDYTGRHASGVNAGGLRRLGRVLPEIPLSVASAKMWLQIEDLVDDDCGFTASCQIKVAETQAHIDQLNARAEQVKKLGYDHEKMIDRDTLRELMPAVSAHCVGGMMVEGDGHANPYRTVQAFKVKCIQLGVRFMEGIEVHKINSKSGIWNIQTNNTNFESQYLVNCAGAWGGKIAAMLGETVPIEAHAPMLMITARMPHFLEPVVGTQGRSLSFKQFQNGTVLIGGGHEGVAYPATNDTALNYRRLAISARSAVTIFPLMHNARIVRSWAGIEGVLPDKMPVIGSAKNEGAFHAFGFSAHGFQLGPIGGKILSELILDGQTALPIKPFQIDRFDVGCNR